MTLPTLTVRIAFSTNPLDATPTWTDVSDYVERVVIRRGRTDELNRFEAGTAEVTLRNADRRFDPTYTSGPYYPNVLPTRKINIRATWSAVTYDLFTGYVEAWPPDWPLRNDSSVTVPCVDAFKYFANTKMSVSFTANTATNYINDTLTLANWPAADRSLNAGISTLQAYSQTNGNVLQMFQLWTESENGFLWMAPDGKVYFRERHHRLIASGSTTSQGTFSDAAGASLPYSVIEPSYDDTFIYNEVQVTRVGGSVQAATDSASIVAHWRRWYEKTGLIMATDAEASDAANWLLAQFKDPALRFKRITLNLEAASGIPPHALGREFHNRITVVRTPPGGGNTITQDCFIEGVEHEIDGGPVTRWLTHWNLSPASSTSYWVLGTAGYSELGTTTKLAY